MFVLASTTRDELNISFDFLPTKEEADKALVADIILMTKYQSIEEIKAAAARGECGFDVYDCWTSAWAETETCGTGQWSVVEVPDAI